jgi:hypothetical protein
MKELTRLPSRKSCRSPGQHVPRWNHGGAGSLTASRSEAGPAAKSSMEVMPAQDACPKREEERREGLGAHVQVRACATLTAHSHCRHSKEHLQRRQHLTAAK